MARKLTISLPDDMFEKLKDLKEEFCDGQKGDIKFSRKISGVCQRALAGIIVEAEVSRVYRMAGIDDGMKAASLLPERDLKFIIKVLRGEGAYKKWSRFERVTVLNDHFGNDNAKYNELTPRFKKLMDGDIDLDDWVKNDPDKRSEMCWSYLEGCFEGIAKTLTEENKSYEV